MHSEQTHTGTQQSAAGANSVAVCPNCRAQMPGELRFCRACGFRLGEGVAEFTETVRFDKSPTAATQARATGDAPSGAKTAPPKAVFPKWNTCASVNDWGALARDVHQKVVKNATKHIERQQQKLEEREREERRQEERKPRRRSRWMLWMMLFIIFAVIASNGGFRGTSSSLRGLRERLRALKGSTAAASRSWVGTSDLKTTDKGVTFDKVEPAGSPADKAGLVGGDLITTFDGQPVKSADGLMKLLTATPVGKTVDVIYLRDGETKTTKLTTVSQDEIERIEDMADDSTNGYVGIGGSSERVAIPGTNISGVQLNSIRRNNPAYIAGMRDGDIVIEFDGAPIRTYAELESRTRRAVPDSTVKAVVMRGQERLELLIKVGIDD